MCVRVRRHVHIFVHLWVNTEGVTLFKESPQRLIVKQREVKDKPLRVKEVLNGVGDIFVCLV